MKNLTLISTGMFALFMVLPFKADASYCGERICHSYDRNGACNNYTCFGTGYYGGYREPYNYGGHSSYRDPYYRSSYRNVDYGVRRYYGNYDPGYYDYRYYDSNRSRTRRSSYYWNDYHTPRYTDRVYVPKAGYYYRY